jgi:AcrR family transcriptional regulator
VGGNSQELSTAVHQPVRQPPDAPFDAASGASHDPARSLRRAVSDADKAARRTDILSAAKHVFAERGYHATTIADIARQAGLSYGSIYWYYESKETLFHELMSAEASALRAYINKAVRETPGDGSPAAPFEAAVRATLEFYEADRPLVKLLFRDAFALGSAFEQHLYSIHASFVDDAERLVVLAQRQGAMIEGPSKMMAFAITSLVGQLAHRRLTTDDGMSAGVAAGFVVDVLLNGLRPRGAPPS